MIDRPHLPSPTPNLGSWLLLLSSIASSSCSGKRFTALSHERDASVNTSTTSDETASKDQTSSLIPPVVTSNAASVTDAGNTPNVSNALDAGTEHTSGDSDGPGEASQSRAPHPDASMESDDPTAHADGSVDETTSELPSASLDGSLADHTSVDVPTYPCNDGEFETPREVRGLGFDNNLWGPGIAGDGQHLYFGHTAGDEDLFVAPRNGSDPTSFSSAQPLTTLNTGNSEGTPFVTTTGLSLYFYATREGGPGDRDLWHASRASLDANFDNPALVAGVNAQAYDHLPWLSEDELTLCYTTLRDDGLGQSDIWMATRATKEDPFDDHTLVPGINSDAREDAVAFSPDGLTVFFSTDRDTDGDLDIWHATRSAVGEDFTDAHVIAGMNSDAEDTNLSLTNDGRHLYFSSGRSGEQRIWVASRTCEPPLERSEAQ